MHKFHSEKYNSFSCVSYIDVVIQLEVKYKLPTVIHTQREGKQIFPELKMKGL